MSKESTIATVTGIVFRRTIRSSYACLDVLLPADSNNYEDVHVIASVQFQGVYDACQFRSNLKRMCKIGNEIQLKGCWVDENNFDVHLDVGNDDEHHLGLKIVQPQVMNTIQCQNLREKFCPVAVDRSKATALTANDNHITQSHAKKHPPRKKEKGNSEGNADKIHSGGLSKREQGEIVRDFLIQVIAEKELPQCNSFANDKTKQEEEEEEGTCTSYLMKIDNHVQLEHCRVENMDRATLKKVINFLNSGSGVLDVAGGSGHVSLAFSQLGIKSTVIDPRETVGKLPGRDRKILKKAIRGKKNAMDNGEMHHESFLPPPIEYASLRAWFAKRPEGIDASFREGKSSGQLLHDDEAVPICTICSPENDDLLRNCSAIVSLHPDEATGDIVDFAVEHRIPFLIVPCCVFSRLFPHRFVVDENDEGKHRFVSTYKDLIQYLARKHSSIRMSKLGFSGANIVLWSMFPKEENN
jgi:hypothetical protein